MTSEQRRRFGFLWYLRTLNAPTTIWYLKDVTWVAGAA